MGTELHIRGLDPDTAQAVKSKAKAKGQSVNKTIGQLLSQAVAVHEREPAPTPAHGAIDANVVRTTPGTLCTRDSTS